MNGRSWTRRDFLRTSAGASVALGIGKGSGWRALDAGGGWNPMRLAPEVAPNGLTLAAAQGVADIGGGVTSPAWMLNGSLPSPLIRVRRGDHFGVSLDNRLPDPLILHWHGLTPPEASDGHPRFAIDPGE